MRYSILAFRIWAFRAIGARILAISEHEAIKDCILGMKDLKLASSEHEAIYSGHEGADTLAIRKDILVIRVLAIGSIFWQEES